MAFIEIFAKSRWRGRCRSCDAVIEWGQLAKSSKWMPFDGEILAVQTKQHPDTRAAIEVVDTSVTPSHFKSCPESERWRRGRTRA